jgi:hypothetical protein
VGANFEDGTAFSGDVDIFGEAATVSTWWADLVQAPTDLFCLCLRAVRHGLAANRQKTSGRMQRLSLGHGIQSHP